MKLNEQQIAEIEAIAGAAGVDLAALLAVIEVESGGRIFAKVAGRHEPLIRFEGHYFHRFLRGEARDEAVAQGLASPKMGAVANPARQAARWALLKRAAAINRIAAYSSSSWGVGQVMGSHWQWLGYGSVDALVAEARSGLGGQVRLMLRFIEKAGLRKALKSCDWAAFARGYNGPAYRRNRYDEQMAKANALWQKRLAAGGRGSGEEDGILGFGNRGPAVSTLQRQLSRVGYLLKADGLFGLKSERVVRQFQRDHLLPETGLLGAAERALLMGQKLAKTKAKLRQLGANLRSEPRRPRGGLLDGLLSFFRRLA